MGEYIKYKNRIIKLGTCESLYYVCYPKYTRALESGQLTQERGSLSPEQYAKADTGFLFRFPFPDEDHLKLGDVEDYRRGVPVTITERSVLDDGPSRVREPYPRQIEITQQKLIHRNSDGKLCLVLVYRDPYLGSSFRVEDDTNIKEILKQLIRNNIVQEKNPQNKAFYREIARRIINGYQLKNHTLKIVHQQKNTTNPRISTTRKKPG